MTDRGAKIIEAVRHIVAAREELASAFVCAREAHFDEFAILIARAGRGVREVMRVVEESLRLYRQSQEDR